MDDLPMHQEEIREHQTNWAEGMWFTEVMALADFSSRTKIADM